MAGQIPNLQLAGMKTPQQEEEEKKRRQMFGQGGMSIAPINLPTTQGPTTEDPTRRNLVGGSTPMWTPSPRELVREAVASPQMSTAPLKSGAPETDVDPAHSPRVPNDAQPKMGGEPGKPGRQSFEINSGTNYHFEQDPEFQEFSTRRAEAAQARADMIRAKELPISGWRKAAGILTGGVLGFFGGDPMSGYRLVAEAKRREQYYPAMSRLKAAEEGMKDIKEIAPAETQRTNVEINRAQESRLGSGRDKFVKSYLGNDNKMHFLMQRPDSTTYELDSEDAVLQATTGMMGRVYGAAISATSAKARAAAGEKFYKWGPNGEKELIDTNTMGPTEELRATGTPGVYMRGDQRVSTFTADNLVQFRPYLESGQSGVGGVARVGSTRTTPKTFINLETGEVNVVPLVGTTTPGVGQPAQPVGGPQAGARQYAQPGEPTGIGLIRKLLTENPNLKTQLGGDTGDYARALGDDLREQGLIDDNGNLTPAGTQLMNKPAPRAAVPPPTVPTQTQTIPGQGVQGDIKRQQDMAIPVNSATRILLGDRDDPKALSMKDFADLADDKGSQQRLGTFFRMMLDSMTRYDQSQADAPSALARYTGGTATDLIRAGTNYIGLPGLIAAQETKAMQDVANTLTPRERQYANVATAAIGDVSGYRKAVGGQAAHYTVAGLMRELPLIGLEGATLSSKDYYQKLGLLTQPAKNIYLTGALNPKIAPHKEYYMSEIDRINALARGEKDPGNPYAGAFAPGAATPVQAPSAPTPAKTPAQPSAGGKTFPRAKLKKWATEHNTTEINAEEYMKTQGYVVK